jgi:hypothetical protein
VVVAGFSPERPGLSSRPVCVGFVMDKVALGQVYFFSKYFGFPRNFHLTDGPYLFIYH